jgi:glycolate oxidase iron-sulfur subunit
MQTSFTDAQLADPDTNASEKILRACVHCGFCTATCPTYVLLGDELDSPRGRIYLIKDMLENDRPATPEVVKHIDRCLSCLSRRAFGIVLPNPNLFRASMWLARLGVPFAGLMPAQLKAALALVPSRLPSASLADKPQVFKSEGQRTRRVALLNGCAQQVLAPQINEATIRLLTRHGCEVVVAAGAGCCGALTHHLGQDAHEYARANIVAWTKETVGGGLDAIVINASGCGTTVKDYGFMFRNDLELAERARIVSSLTRDITELMSEIGLQAHVNPTGQRVAYHSACSLQHGQQIREQPKRLLKEAGFVVLDPPEGHLCCGSAGTYNLLQPEIARRLRDRKVANIGATSPDLIAAGNIGCLTQIASGTKVPVVHTVELLDWATGGPRPKASVG